MIRTNYLRVFTVLLAMAAVTLLTVMIAYGSASAKEGDDQSSISSPEVIDVSPDPGTTDVSKSAPGISVTFDTSMNPDTINEKTFRLHKKGSSKIIPANIEYDPDTRTATLEPVDSNGGPRDLASDIRYKVHVVSGRSGVKSEDGGKLGWVTEQGAGFKNGSVHWLFRTG